MAEVRTEKKIPKRQRSMKHKQCHCKNGGAKVGGWAQAERRPIFILGDRPPATGPYPCFLPSSRSPPSGLLPASLQTVGTDGIINEHDNWKDHSEPILLGSDDLRNLRKHTGKCLTHPQSQGTCVHAWGIFFQAQHLRG